MANPFGTDDMAAGYASARPDVHPRILSLAFEALRRPLPFRRALDVGCGAGVSTRALAGFARERIGLEPAIGMLTRARGVAPGASFVAGAAERLPFAPGALDVITAAGSLNYVDLDRFFPEAGRVLGAAGALIVYDFEAGRSFATDIGLEGWFDDFTSRFPYPQSERRPLSPEILGRLRTGFRVLEARDVEVRLVLEPSFYLEYVLTETNVAAAVRSGVRPGEIRSWCKRTLDPVWSGQPRDVLFRGYYACLVPAP